jgi:hypothetical protein
MILIMQTTPVIVCLTKILLSLAIVHHRDELSGPVTISYVSHAWLPSPGALTMGFWSPSKPLDRGFHSW